jgi:multicomponent Na+:H+ antiporter subunit D
MSSLVPLTVAIPLLAAALVGAAGHWVPIRVFHALAVAVAATVTALSIVLLVHVNRHELVYWFGGWQPRHGLALGIAFTVDPIGAAHAALVGVLATAALLASWTFFEEQEVGHLYYTLMLLFLGGMVGFSLTGDLFNMFVWFELMGVAAYALTGFQVRQPAVLQGAINFAVTNSIGAFAVLLGIALLYGRTAALNFQQLGAALAGRPVDGLVVAAFVLLAVGFLVKAGAVPFHFWLSDAYAVAPAPVGVLLAGIMSDLGFHAVGRIYWDVFAGATGAAGGVRWLLVGVGVLTALVGGVMCLLEADLKRIVAFLVIGHGGIFLVGIGLLDARGLAGSTAYVVTDGLLKGALFLAIGVAVHRLGASDELLLHGKGRRLRWLPLGLVFLVCGLGFAALPPFGPFVSKALIEQSASAHGYGWLPPLLTAATILPAAAVLRATGRIFLSLGPAHDPLLRTQPDEPAEGEPSGDESKHGVKLSVLGPAVALVVLALGVAFVPGLAGRTEIAARRFEDHRAKEAEVLHGRLPAPPPPPYAIPLGAGSYAYGAASTALALGLGLVLLYRRRLPGAVRAAARPLGAAVPALRAAHSGAVTDYVAYIAAGGAVVGAVWAITLR